MKCSFRFKVHGILKPVHVASIPIRGVTYDFETEEGLVTHIRATIAVPDKENWPKVLPSSAPGVKYDLHLNTPAILPFVQRELRAVQGLLCFYGVHAIEIDNPEVEWMPENDIEKAELPIQSFKRKTQGPPPSAFPPIGFDLIARAFIAA